jgi:hypothetical protein
MVGSPIQNQLPAHDSNPTIGPHNPVLTSPNSSRRLQEVFQTAGVQLEKEERIALIVHSFEADLKKSGMSVDLSQLKKQINYL